MWPVFQALLAIICTAARSRLSLQLEIVALRHQLSVYRRSVERPRIRPGDGGSTWHGRSRRFARQCLANLRAQYCRRRQRN